jgi:hypothetical protein
MGLPPDMFIICNHTGNIYLDSVNTIKVDLDKDTLYSTLKTRASSSQVSSKSRNIQKKRSFISIFS